MPGWERLKAVVAEEFGQSKQEGRDEVAVESLRPALAAAGDDAGRLLEVHQQLLAIPIRPDFPFNEPSDLEGIRQMRGEGPRRLPWAMSDEQLLDRMYGAWLGRCCGCALGKPVEGFMWPQNGLSSRGRIKAYLTAVSPSEYPLNNYFPEHSPAEETAGKSWCSASTREHIVSMESDDDIRYTVLGQVILRNKGKTFTSADVACAWIENLPYRYVCTAETQAYRNLVAGTELFAGEREIDWNWVANNLNPYREWIGAQIRADSWGYAAPGDLELAAEFAWRDARISHVKNGIYGEMFIAAMIAAAFACDDPLTIVKSALAEIPATSRLHRDITQTIAICAKHHNSATSFEPALDDLCAALGHYHPVHTNNNAALVVAGLLLGGHDFEKVITIAVMGGWDTDCNGATVGSIVGAMLGAKALPAKWTGPLHDKLESGILGYHPIAISECAQRSVVIARACIG